MFALSEMGEIIEGTPTPNRRALVKSNTHAVVINYGIGIYESEYDLVEVLLKRIVSRYPELWSAINEEIGGDELARKYARVFMWGDLPIKSAKLLIEFKYLIFEKYPELLV